MRTENALMALKNAKAEKRDWREVSGIVNEILTSNAWRGEYANMTAWLEAASETSGYSSSMLRRMVAARDFLERTKDEFGVLEVLVDNATRAPFAAIELLKRIHDIDPEKAKELFGRIVAGEISHRGIQSVYNDISGPSLDGRRMGRMSNPSIAPQRLGRQQANEHLRIGCEAVIANLATITGDAQARFYYREFRFSYATPVAVALKYKDNGIDWIDGFDVKRVSRFVGYRRKQLLAEFAFSATFFRNYWIIIDEAEEEYTQQLLKDVRKLELHSIGIAEFDMAEPGRLRVLHKPELSAQPDRQATGIREVMGQGIPDFVTVG